MAEVLERVASTGKPVRAVTESILEAGTTCWKDDGSAYTDPHVWRCRGDAGASGGVRHLSL